MTTVEEDHRARCLEHQAFVYGTDDEYVTTMVPLVGRAVSGGEPVVAILTEPKAALLRAALGPAEAQVSWEDAQDFYRHPVRTIAAHERMLRRMGPDAAPVLVGEVEIGPTERDQADWARYEAAFNGALAHHCARAVCLYDTRRASDATIDAVRRTHPQIFDGTSPCANPHYTSPEAFLRGMAHDLGVPPGPPDHALTVERSLRDGRDAFMAAAIAWGLKDQQARELSVGISEVLTNALVHGGGSAHLQVWRGQDALVCLIEDRGAGTDDPLVGYVPPRPGATGGYGLWLTRQLFDRTELARGPDGGMRVLLTADRRPPER